MGSTATALDAQIISEPESTIVELTNQLHNTQSEYQQSVERESEYKIRLKRAEEELEQMKSELETCRKSLNCLRQEYAILEERLYGPGNLLERYRSLSAAIRKGLSNVICDKDEIRFIASCSTPDHLKAIWIYTRQLAGNNGDTAALTILKDIFDYFFDVFNSSLSEPMYMRDGVDRGYPFDDDKYDRSVGSAMSGVITQVVLRGYKSVNTGAIICRSLVQV